MPRYSDLDDGGDVAKKVKLVLGLGVLLVILATVLSSFRVVSAGERGVKTRLGVVEGVLDPGLHFKLPWLEKIVLMDVQTKKEQTDASAASSDLQTVMTTVAVNYNLEYDRVGDLYQRIGKDYGPKVIDPTIQEVVKSVTAKYTAEQLITKRTAVTDEIQTQLVTKLAQSDIRVTQVSIVNFKFSESFDQAIEAKVTAEQTALASKNKLDQVKYEAEQRIAEARGEAEAIKIQAEAIQSQGGAEYVQLQWIEAWKSGGAKVPDYISGSGSANFLMSLPVSKQ